MKMKLPLADIMLKMEKIGNSVPKKQVTPPEVMYLVACFHGLAGGDPILSITPSKGEDGEPIFVEMSTAQEKARLVSKYGFKCAKFFPGRMPEMPDTFEEARMAALGADVGGGEFSKFMMVSGEVQGD